MGDYMTAKLHVATDSDALPDRGEVDSVVGEKFDPVACFNAMANLPGVVLYQRRVNPDGDIRYTYISEGAKEIFGVEAHEILTNPDALFKTHGADYRAKFRERLIGASRALAVWDVEA